MRYSIKDICSADPIPQLTALTAVVSLSVVCCLRGAAGSVVAAMVMRSL